MNNERKSIDSILLHRGGRLRFGSVAKCTTSDCYVGDISTKPSLEEIRTPRGFVALIRRLILQSPSLIQ